MRTCLLFTLKVLSQLFGLDTLRENQIIALV